MSDSKNREPSADIFQLLQEDSERKKGEVKKEKSELLYSLGIKEYFKEGSIKIDMKTCRGVECKLCIKACPNSALYWKSGEIAVTEGLCNFCAACVLNCMVDNCIEVTRKRPNGETERFTKPIDVIRLLNRINAQNRKKRTEARSITIQENLKQNQK